MHEAHRSPLLQLCRHRSIWSPIIPLIEVVAVAAGANKELLVWNLILLTYKGTACSSPLRNSALLFYLPLNQHCEKKSSRLRWICSILICRWAYICLIELWRDTVLLWRMMTNPCIICSSYTFIMYHSNKQLFVFWFMILSSKTKKQIVFPFFF